MIDLLSYSSSNVTTSSYVEVDASLLSSAANLVIVDTSTQLMKLAVGAAGSEQDIAVFQGNGYPVLIQSIYIPKGSRISVKAISGTASSGYLGVSYS